MNEGDYAERYEQGDRDATLQAVLNRNQQQQEHDNAGNVICVDCGTVIPARRLAALPDACRCVICQQRSER